MNVSKSVADLRATVRRMQPYLLRAGTPVAALAIFAGLVAASCGDSRLSAEQYASWCETAGARIAEALYEIDGWDAFASVVDDVATEGKRLTPPEGHAEQHEAYVFALRDLANPPFFIEWAIEALFELLSLTTDLASFLLGYGRDELISDFSRTGMSREVVANAFSLDCGRS